MKNKDLKEAFGVANESFDVAIECMLFAGLFKTADNGIKLPDENVIAAAVGTLVLSKAAMMKKQLTTEELNELFKDTVAYYENNGSMENWREIISQYLKD